MSRHIRAILIITAASFLLPGPGWSGAAAASSEPSAETGITGSVSTPAAEPDSSAYRHRATWAPPFDEAVFRAINTNTENRIFDRLMPFITDFDNWRIVLLAVWAGLLVFGGARGRWAALLLILTVAASDQLCASVIKPLTGRLRPCEVLGGVHFWSDTEGWMTTPIEIARSYKSSFSFPSNHASNMTAAMLLLGLVYRKGLPWFLLIAVAVSFSRIYVGVHWPLDVAAGMAIGATLATLAYLLHRRIGRTRWRAVE